MKVSTKNPSNFAKNETGESGHPDRKACRNAGFLHYVIRLHTTVAILRCVSIAKLASLLCPW